MNKKILKRKVNYSIFRPAGNDTAFIYGLEYSQNERKQINDLIMKKHTNIEQVGFIDLKNKPELQMAGGEFCGNATRSAASLYLKGKSGQLQLIVNYTDFVNAGVDENGKAWCEIPLYYGDNVIIEKENGIFIVKMKGMVIVVIDEEMSIKYIEDKENLKSYGKNIISKYNLEENEAVGVMFCENINGVTKINPIVWVKAIDTLFYETACGSGTTAVCMVKAFKLNQSVKKDVLQPSGLVITADIKYNKETFEKAVILGNVENDGKIYTIELG